MTQIILADGLEPMPLLRPASAHDLGDIVRQAAAESSIIYPVGGQTKMHLAALPDALNRKRAAVETLGLDQVIDYPARDMTITVEAGITISRLQQILAPEKQSLPIDVPDAGQATLGGILATNTSGSRRLGHGTLRDYLLGFTAINDEGNPFKAGGRVVKNVAGYDLCKLMIGSFGTLGIITQATLKLKPLPEEQAGMILGCETGQLDKVLDRLHGSRTRPVCIDVFNGEAAKMLFGQAGLEAPASDWVVLAGFEGNGETVHWQVQQLARELGELGLGTAGAISNFQGGTAHALCRTLVEFPALKHATLSLKANILPSGLAEFCRRAGSVSPPVLLQAHAGNGIVLGHFRGGLAKEQAEGVVQIWRELAAALQGSVVVTRCPAAWRTAQYVWGPARGDVALMRGIKEKFDPKRIFNPGRFVDGI